MLSVWRLSHESNSLKPHPRIANAHLETVRLLQSHVGSADLYVVVVILDGSLALWLRGCWAYRPPRRVFAAIVSMPCNMGQMATYLDYCQFKAGAELWTKDPNKKIKVLGDGALSLAVAYWGY